MTVQIPWAPGALFLHLVCRLGEPRPDGSDDGIQPDLMSQAGTVTLTCNTDRIRFPESDGRKRMLSTGKGAHFQFGQLQRLRAGAQHSLVVFDQVDRPRRLRAGIVQAHASSASSNSTVNSAPPPSTLHASREPPSSLAIIREMASPSPSPCPADLVVKKGSKRCGSVAESIPLPLSRTTMRPRPSARLA